MSGIIAQNSGRHTGLVKASSGGGGVWNLIKTYTASSDSDLSFVEGTDGVDFTAYDEFVFKFSDIHPSNASTRFSFNGSIDAGSNYNVTKTTTMFIAGHIEDDSDALLTYQTGDDLAQSTSFQDLAAYGESETANDGCLAGTLHLFGLSDTTFVKHFIARTNYMAAGGPYSVDSYTAGYFNTTSAIDAIQFKFSSNNIDAGTISLYGIS
jgi:hypothetical protein